jgi:hypothetical protein
MIIDPYEAGLARYKETHEFWKESSQWIIDDWIGEYHSARLYHGRWFQWDDGTTHDEPQTTKIWNADGELVIDYGTVSQ